VGSVCTPKSWHYNQLDDCGHYQAETETESHSIIETDTATSGLRWIFHMHSEFSRPAMCNNAIMIISSQM
jgi:hypothetical protein